MRTIANISFLLIFMFVQTAARVDSGTDYDGLSVIVNSDNAHSSLTQKEFLKIIQGQQQRWESGDIVKITFLRTSNPTGLKVANDVFDMSSNEFNKYWLSLVFEGKCKAPVLFASEEDLINYVSQNKGAIGIISSKVSTTRVKTLKITE